MKNLIYFFLIINDDEKKEPFQQATYYTETALKI